MTAMDLQERREKFTRVKNNAVVEEEDMLEKKIEQCLLCLLACLLSTWVLERSVC